LWLITLPPAATVRMAPTSSPAGVSLGKNPATPAASARRRLPGLPSIVKISTRHRGHCSRKTAAAVSPSVPGMSMSTTATSGCARTAAGTTAVPSDTRATTSMSSSRLSTAASVSARIRMSSASSTRIGPSEAVMASPVCWLPSPRQAAA